MSILKTFWTIKTYKVKGERWWWVGAVLEINMLNAMERVSGLDIKHLRLVERDPKHWGAVFWDPQFNQKTIFYVYMQEEMPVLPSKERVIITDHRPKDRFWLDKEHSAPPRPGFKAMPMEFRF